MNFNEVVVTLKENGFEIKVGCGYKNGIADHNIRIGSGKVRPCLWGKQLEHIKSNEELIRVVNDAMDNNPYAEVNSNDFVSAEYVKGHVISCIRPIRYDDVLTLGTKYEGVEEYFRIVVGEGNGLASIVIKRKMFPNNRYSIRQVQEWARENTKNNTVIKSMQEVLAEFMGADAPVIPEDACPMYVLSNINRIHGASGILIDEILEDFCHKHNTNKVTIIPSSIHECILIPDSIMNQSDLSSMIQEINDTQVVEEERLSHRPYYYIAK